MATSTAKILFSTPTKLKQAAVKRANKFGMTLTEVLNEALELFVSGGVDSMPLSKAELVSIRKSEQEIREGKLIPLEQILKECKIK